MEASSGTAPTRPPTRVNLRAGSLRAGKTETRTDEKTEVGRATERSKSRAQVQGKTETKDEGDLPATERSSTRVVDTVQDDTRGGVCGQLTWSGSPPGVPGLS